MPLLQTERLLTLSTPLGADALHIQSMEGTEGISRLFHFNLVLVSEKNSIALADLVGQRVTIGIEQANRQFRHINGFVSRFAQGDVDSRVSHYYAEVVPWLWFLTRTADCRIFQKKTVPDIIQQIFKDLGFTDYKLQLQGTFEPRDYCVQYRETDFAFVSRLMEEEGMFYFFEHSNGKHTMIIGNSPGVHQPCPGQPQARYAYLSGGAQVGDVVQRWHMEQEFQPGKSALADYYFQTPSNRQMVQAPSAIKVAGNDKFEIYDYPGYYAKRFDGDDKAGKVPPDGVRTVKLLMQGPDALHKVINGAGTCRGFQPGYQFELTGHRRSDLNGPYVIVQVSHAASNSLGSNGDEAVYDNTFICIPLAVPFRPARMTPRPVVHGSQTAVVVGLAGEEIDTDKYGRIKVQFHWDREGKKDQNSSCWVRVATPWAGKTWGMISIPRIGQEVVIDFMEGDPDQPLVIGSVYNADQMPPYALPANKTQSGIVSRSSLGGTPDNFNEICFEDKKGDELIYLRAEKNQTIAVNNDEVHWVGNNRSKTVDNDETTIVYHDRTETVDNNETITIHGNRTETVDKNESITVSQDRTRLVSKNETVTVALMRTHTVGINEAITVGAAQEVTVGAMRTVSVGAAQIITVGASQSLTVGKNLTESVGGDHNSTVGKDAMHKIAKKLMIDAGDEIIIKTGAASIVMKKDGSIAIMGKDITITATGEMVAKADKNITMKGKKILQN